VTIYLPTSFPVCPPIAVFDSETFPSNVLAGQVGNAPKGLACLGALTDSYRPDMNFGQSYQMLVDIVSYRQYEAQDLWDSHGALTGAAWLAKVSGSARQDDEGSRRLDICPSTRTRRLRG
jgi:hypothetical protein